jgi:sugar/nucleoside kinase (ribokinase family)
MRPPVSELLRPEPFAVKTQTLVLERPTPTPVAEPLLLQLSSNSIRAKVFAVSTATVDYTVPSYINPRDLEPKLHREIKEHRPGDKVAIDLDTFKSYLDELQDREVDLHQFVGGNAINVGQRRAALRNPDEGPIAVYTWAGNDEHGNLVEQDLRSGGMSLRPFINRIDGNTPASLVIPRIGEDGKIDRTVFSFKPKEMPSEFASWLQNNQLPESANVNSLTGPHWPKELRAGIGVLHDRGVPVDYTPGSSQLRAIVDGVDANAISAVYDGAIKGSRLLSVNKEELFTLIAGTGETPSEKPKEFLAQGLALGVENILVTLGPDGLLVAQKNPGQKKDGRAWVSASTPDVFVGSLGAGDAAAAGASDELGGSRDIVQAGRIASANASFALEHEGAHVNPPTRPQLTHRLRTRPPKVVTF